MSTDIPSSPSQAGAETPGGRSTSLVEAELEALLAEQCQGWRRGAGVPAGELLQHHPALAADAQAAAEVIYREWALRQERGEAPDFEEYLRQNPDLGDELRRWQEADRVLDQLAGAPAGQGPPRRLADYQLLEELGRGGMGVVFKAHQTSLNRLVAVKMILAGQFATPAAVQRFRREAEAVAALDHPNIVPVYEVGEYEGRHFFAMKLIEGASLDRHVDRFTGDHPAAARLMETVARAVQHAHERGVLHRDLKPANILLARPVATRSLRVGLEDHTQPACGYEPHVTDFGLAKRLAEDRSATETEAIVGTPSYMAPEQASGRRGAVTTLADVYSLGAILYELLTGRPPFQGKTPLETLVQVQEQEPERPGRLRPGLPRDLEAVCLKCLEKEPRKRYPSAADLAADLERFRNGQPTVARPVGPARRLWRWCRRRPVTAALSAALVLALLGGFAGVAWQWQRAEHQARQTARERDATRQKEELAQANLRRALQAVDRMLTKVAEERLARVPQMQQLRADLLEEAMKLLAEILQDNPTDPAVRLEAGRAYLRVGDLRLLLGQPAAAEDVYRRALELVEALAAGHPDSLDSQKTLLICWVKLGNALALNNKLEDAGRASEQMHVVLQALPPEAETDPDVRHARAAFTGNQGFRLLLANHFHEAEPPCRQALELLERLAAQFPDQAKYRSDLASAYNTLAVILKKTGRLPDAQQAYQQALTLQTRLVAGDPADGELRARLGTTHRNLAILLGELRRPAEALAAFDQAQAVYDKLARDFPNFPFYRSELGEIAEGKALVLVQLGQGEKAQSLLEAAVEEQKLALKPNPQYPMYRQRLRNHLFHLAELLIDRGDHERGAEAVRQMSAHADRPVDTLTAAGLLARCAQLAEEERRLPPEKRRDLVQAYGGQAVELLRAALGNGKLQVSDLKDDAALVPLKSRRDFQELMTAGKGG
jgi:serine/threonine protein kinase/tetratricopeptide (TPR) repeat protein